MLFRSIPPAGHRISLKCLMHAASPRRDNFNPLSEYGGRSSYFLSSGTGALTLALCALTRLGHGEIIFPAYTCPSLLASVLRAGLRPVLCDIKTRGFGMDLQELERKAGPATLGIIAVHLFGMAENMDAVQAIASRHGITVIEDATQAFGNRYCGNQSRKGADCLGTLGDIGLFSFRRGKPLSFMGGGALLVNNPEFRESVELLYGRLPQKKEPSSLPYLLQILVYSLFFHPRLYWIPQRIPWLRLGETIFTTDYNVARLNPRVLGIARQICGEMEEIRSARLRAAKAYLEALAPYRQEFMFLPETADLGQVLLRFPLVFSKKGARDRALESLKKRGLGGSCMYPAPVNDIAGVPTHLFGIGSFPNARRVSENILTLPLHGYVRAEDAEAAASEIIRSL